MLSAPSAAVREAERWLDLGNYPSKNVQCCDTHLCLQSRYLCHGVWLIVVSDLGLGFRGGLPEENWTQISDYWFEPSVGPWRIKLWNRAKHFLWLHVLSAETRTSGRFCKVTHKNYIMLFSFCYFVCGLIYITECQRKASTSWIRNNIFKN